MKYHHLDYLLLLLPTSATATTRTRTTTAAFVLHQHQRHQEASSKKYVQLRRLLLLQQQPSTPVASTTTTITTTTSTTASKAKPGGPFYDLFTPATTATRATATATTTSRQQLRLFATSSSSFTDADADADSDATTGTSTIRSSNSSNNNDNNDHHSKKIDWHVFWDLECPFARKNWQQLPALQQAFAEPFEFHIHLTSLAFHPAAWIGQCAAFMIRRECGVDAWHAFIDACYQHQHLYKDDLKDARPSELAAVFADIAANANLFTTTTTTAITTTTSSSFTREYLLQHITDWNEIIKPTYQEHKYALEQGVFGTPKHVINGTLVPDTESSWGVEEWRDKLQSMGLLE